MKIRAKYMKENSNIFFPTNYIEKIIVSIKTELSPYELQQQRTQE